MQDVYWGLFQSIGWYATGVANWEDIRSVSPPQPISWGRTSRRIYWPGRATRVRMQIANISFPLRHSSLLCQFIWQIIQVGIWNIRTKNEKSTFLGHLRMWLPSLVGKWLEEARGEGDSTQFSLSLPAACYSATVSTALIDGKITNPRKTEILAKYNLLPNPISFDSHNLSSFVWLVFLPVLLWLIEILAQALMTGDDDIYIMVKCLCVSKSHYFRFKRISSFLLFLDIFQIQKCIETVKRQNPLK